MQLKLFKKNKERNRFLIVLAFLIFLLTPVNAMAWSWDSVVGVFTSLPMAAVLTVLGIILLISRIFSSLCIALLNFVTKPDFIGLSYTRPESKGDLEGNPIIEIGLSITQDFVNLSLVVILIYIAFAIALRLGDLNAKKLLFRLIAIAFLVNFAPVVVGLIVDASNIFMNFFLVNIGESFSNMGNMFYGRSESLSNNLSQLFTFSGQTYLITQALILVALNLVTGISMFLFAGVFTVRYLIIWILVILSPLAFVAWILPATNKYWKMWWNNLVHWSIIGIPLAFALYLSARAMEILPSVMHTNMTSEGLEPQTVGLLNEVFPYFVVAIILFAGFSIGLTTSAAGANIAMNYTKKGGQWAASKVRKGTGTATTMALGKSGMDRVQRQASADFYPDWVKKTGTLGKIAYAPTIGLPYWASRRAIGEIGLRLSDAERKDISKTKEKNKGESPERILTSLRDSNKTLNRSSSIGTLVGAIEEKKHGKLEQLGLREDEITKIGRWAFEADPESFNKIKEAFPDLVGNMVSSFSEENREKAGLTISNQERNNGITLPMKIMMKIKPELIPQIHDEGLLNDEIQTFFHTKYASTSQVSSLLERGSFKAKNLYIETVKKNGLNFYKETAPHLANYFESNPGIRALGGNIPAEGNQEEGGEEELPFSAA
jgi:hypothetical protein